MALLRTTSSMTHELFSKYDACNRFIREMNSLRDDLPSILEFHKRVWKHSVQHPNFGPNEYGMFRTNDILTMSSDEVYLGTSNLMTNTLTYWEGRKKAVVSDLQRNGKPVILPDFYLELCHCYKEHLMSNLKMMRSQVFDNGVGREKLCENVIAGMNKISEFNQGSVKSYGYLEILNTSIADNRILNCRLKYRDELVNTSFLNVGGRFLVPEGFEKGVQLNSKNVGLFSYVDVMESLVNNGNVKAITLNPDEVKEIHNGSQLRELSRSEAKENIRNLHSVEKRGFRYGV